VLEPSCAGNERRCANPTRAWRRAPMLFRLDWTGLDANIEIDRLERLVVVRDSAIPTRQRPFTQQKQTRLPVSPWSDEHAGVF
jgi:hypothetical protein